MTTNCFDDAPVISGYTRAQAISDGVLMDVTEQARETGFVVPVAMTCAAYAEAVAVSTEAQGYGQSVRGRLHDVLFVLYVVIKMQRQGGQIVTFRVQVNNGPGASRWVTLKSHIGPGDNMEPVITIMLPKED